MIAGIFHEGSGLGNQLFRYVTVRTLAEKREIPWTMLQPEQFKGDFFVRFNHGEKPVEMADYFTEKKILENGIDVRGYDPEINFVSDDVVIDGEFQDERYWGHNLHEIGKWLKVEPMSVPDNVCLIGFRGGEYAGIPDLFLGKDYWESAIKIMLARGIRKFEVHTDDVETARRFFPDFPIIPNTRISHSKHSAMGYNWRSLRYARNAIIANSSFYILPRLLRHDDFAAEAFTIAPRYWARRSKKVWALPQNYYSDFVYI